MTSCPLVLPVFIQGNSFGLVLSYDLNKNKENSLKVKISPLEKSDFPVRNYEMEFLRTCMQNNTEMKLLILNVL